MKRIKLLGSRMFTTESVGQDQGPKVAVKQTLELRQIETSLEMSCTSNQNNQKQE